MEFVKHRVVPLRNHPSYSEAIVQNFVANDPSILGLGKDVELIAAERRQPRAGRLDLLLQDSDVSPRRRYEVELQLGPVDESHIIRCIEYWDIERKRYPQYDHCAVIVAEEITARFLNVISLFNGQIPLIALQMSAIEVDGKTALVFTKVLDEVQRGLVEEDEEALSTPTDRGYWERKGSAKTMALVDEFLGLLKSIEPKFELNYNKHYIGLSRDGQSHNIVTFRARKKHVNVEIKLPKSEETDAKIEEAGLETLDYNARWQLYRLPATVSDFQEAHSLFSELFQASFDRRENR